MAQTERQRRVEEVSGELVAAVNLAGVMAQAAEKAATAFGVEPTAPRLVLAAAAVLVVEARRARGEVGRLLNLVRKVVAEHDAQELAGAWGER